MKVELRATSFDPWVEMRRHQEEHLAASGAACGATACFVGTMRDFNEGDSVRAMTLEHYPGMTEAHLHTISEEALRRWAIRDTLILHRYGDLRPGEPIVLVAVWSAHRGPAFEACRYLIEELKSRAPFWKREELPDGARWVSHNSPS